MLAALFASLLIAQQPVDTAQCVVITKNNQGPIEKCEVNLYVDQQVQIIEFVLGEDRRVAFGGFADGENLQVSAMMIGDNPPTATVGRCAFVEAYELIACHVLVNGEEVIIAAGPSI